VSGRAPRWLVIGILTLVLVAAGPVAAARHIAPDDYVARLDEALHVARGAIGHPDPASMQAVRQALGLPVTVDFPGGAAQIPADPLLEELSGTTASDFRAASLRLSALRDAAALAASAKSLDRTGLRRAVAEAYRGIGPTTPSLLDRIRARLQAVWRGFLDALTNFRGVGSLLIWALVAALLIGGWLLLRRGALVAEVRGIDVPSPTGAPVDWLRRADEALARGDLQGAVRALYRALLAALARRGTVADEPSLTAGECRAAVGAARPALYPAVAAATTAFERVAYGRVAPTDEDVEALRRAERAARTA
jgi:uncharacterized protein DUF4129